MKYKYSYALSPAAWIKIISVNNLTAVQRYYFAIALSIKVNPGVASRPLGTVIAPIPRDLL